MKILNRIFILILCICLLPTCPSFADDNLFSCNVNIIEENGVFRQQVLIETNQLINLKGQNATLLVWKDDKVNWLDQIIVDYENDLYIGNDIDDISVFAAVLQSKVDNDGKLSFSFYFDDALEKTYYGQIQVGMESDIAHISFNTTDPNIIYNFLDNIDNNEFLLSTSAIELKNQTENYINYIIDTSVYNKLDKQKVWEKTLSYLIENKSKNQTNDLVCLKECLKKATVLEAFASSNDKDLLYQTLEIYEGDVFNLRQQENATRIFNLFLSFDLNKKKEISGSLGNTKYSDISDFVSAFNEKTFIEAIRGCLYYTDTGRIIDDNLDYLSLSEKIEKFIENQEQKNYILKRVTSEKNKINKLSDFISIIEKGIDEYGKDKSPKQRTGSKVSIPKSEANNTLIEPIAVKTSESLTDIRGHWSFEAVKLLADKQIIEGKDNNQFKPDDSITRAEFIKILVLTFELFDKNSQVEFEDVSKEDWYYSYIASAYKNAITKGYEDNTFRPENNITREEIAVLIYRAVERNRSTRLFVKTYENIFSDFKEISPYAQNAVTVLSNLGIIKGNDGQFMPKANATRAETAQMIYNTAKEVGLLQ